MLSSKFLGIVSAIVGTSLFACSSGALRKPGSEPLKVILEPVGIDDKAASRVLELVLDRHEVKSRLKGSRYRILRSEYGGGSRAQETSRGTSWVKVEVYDYSRDRLLTITGDTLARAPLKVQESADQPPPTQDEIDEAVAILKADAFFGPKQADWRPSPAMPGVVTLDDTGATRGLGQHSRLIAIGLIPAQSSFKHEIVGVDLSKGQVVRFPDGAPPKAIAQLALCAPPSAQQATSNRFIPGQANLVIKRGDTVIWQMKVVRPSASSGARGSGIDLRNIEYLGKKVLSQIHVPILNVRYAGDVCGPFRDWQFMEGAFQARGQEITDGILQADSKPMTILDNGQDRGNYRGIAVYTDGTDTVLTTEMESGWYRYKNEYRFGEDGSIRPVWGFGAVQASCVCNTHYHHAFWRMDFELGDGKHNQVQFYDGHEWKPVTRESKFFRESSQERWRVVDLDSGRGYEIAPGPNDGTAINDRYASGDLWALKYEENEMDDHGNDQASWTLLDGFVNREDITSNDIVVWYGGHLIHGRDEYNPNDLSNRPIGPTLRPYQWDK